MKKLLFAGAALILLGPATLLVGVAVVANPAAQAHAACLLPTSGTPDRISNIAGFPSVSNGPPTSVVLPIPAGKFTVTNRFGWRIHPVTGRKSFHTGTDFAAKAGMPILAVADGTVAAVRVDAIYGHSILINHTIAGKRVSSFYGHIESGHVHVRAGQRVTFGQHIADVGTAGLSTGPHVHLEIRPRGPNGRPVNAETWLSTHGAKGLDSPTSGGPGCVPGEFFADGPLPPPPASFTEAMGGRIDDPSGTGGWVTRQLAHLIAQTKIAFPNTGWSCWSARPGTVGEHPVGRACDVTFGNDIGVFPSKTQVAAGWRTAHWLQRNAVALKVQYLIWQGRIWNVDRRAEGWRAYDGGGMFDPTSPTGGHFDHLHISVK